MRGWWTCSGAESVDITELLEIGGIVMDPDYFVIIVVVLI